MVWAGILRTLGPRRLVRGVVGGLVLLAVMGTLGLTVLLGAVAGSGDSVQAVTPVSCVVRPAGDEPPQASGAAAPSPGRWTPAQVANARVITDRGRAAGAGPEGVVVALMAAMQESSLNNLPGGDRDSVGLFQQRPSAGWGRRSDILDPSKAADAFFGVARHTGNGGLLDVSDWRGLPPGVAAQAVQRSAYPTLYARWEPDARALTSWLLSRDGSSLDCTGIHGPAQVSGTWAHPLAPAPYVLVSAFGMRLDPVNGRWSQHRGQDLAVPVGTPERAACEGVVLRTDPSDPFGGGMQTDLDCGGGVVVKYMHQSGFTVRPGDTVQAGQVIGRTGSSGHSTGPHLHFQVNVDGQAVDPVTFMRQRGIRF